VTKQPTMSQQKKIGLPAELRGIKEAVDIFGWNEEDVLWYHYSRDDIKDIPKEVRPTIKAKIVYDWRKQKWEGIDFQHRNDTFDMKTNDSRYKRFCFEMYRKAKGGEWYFKYSKARIIGQELAYNGYTGFYEKGLIEEFLNEWHVTELEGCDAIPDLRGRKYCWLVFIEPELLDNLVLNWAIRAIERQR